MKFGIFDYLHFYYSVPWYLIKRVYSSYDEYSYTVSKIKYLLKNFRCLRITFYRRTERKSTIIVMQS